MTETIQELEERLKKVEETAKKSEVEELLNQEMKDYKGEDEVIHIRDAVESVGSNKFSSGFSQLDFLIEGFHEGDLIAVSGPTGQGKTTLLQSFTINLSKQGCKSVWFTYELTISDLRRKFGDDIPETYTPKIIRENSIVWVERKIVEAIVKYGVKAVFIDPFNSLTKFSSNKLSQELGDLAERLKQVALKYNIIVFVTAHAKRISDEEQYTEDSIRDTSLLGSKADSILNLWRNLKRQSIMEKKENGRVYMDTSTVSVSKNRRNGRVGYFKVVHDGNKFLIKDNSI